MPRKRFLPSDQLPYHVTARSHNKNWFPLEIEKSWAIFSRYLYFISLAYGIRIHSFVLMSNHFHLLLATPHANLDQAMNYFMREVSKAFGAETKQENQIFGGPYHWSLIRNPLHYQHAYKYVYRNPVEAKICRKVQDYPYSTFKMVLGLEKMEFPVFDNMALIQNPDKVISWLNTPYPSDDYLSDLRDALRYSEMEFKTRHSTQRVSPMKGQIF